jgi:hypothetical protein
VEQVEPNSDGMNLSKLQPWPRSGRARIQRFKASQVARDGALEAEVQGESHGGGFGVGEPPEGGRR